MGHAKCVYDEKGDGKTHRGEHHAESWADEDQLPQAEFVLLLDGIEKGESGKDPPGIAIVVRYVSNRLSSVQWERSSLVHKLPIGTYRNSGS